MFLSKKQHEVFYNVRDLYLYLHLPVNHLDEEADFTIHDLKDIHYEFPYSSPVFRQFFFSFVFVKDAFGKYTTDNLAFETVPGTIYFTTPGHYKSYTWKEINETYLITLSEAFLRKNAHSDIFEEFPFLLAETVRPRILQPEAFAEFENIYEQISKEYLSNNPYRNKVIGKLFVVLLLRIKEHFWKDYNPNYKKNQTSKITTILRRILKKIFNRDGA